MSPVEALAVLATNVFFYGFTVAWTAASLLLFWPLLPLTRLLTGWPWDKTTRLWIWVYGRGWLFLVYPFVRFRRAGFTPSVPERPTVFVVNHQSFFDTFFMGGLPFFDVTFAVRSWPFRMFWFRPVMRLAGYLDVEGAPFEETGRRAKELLARGGHILFFPEGHRSRDGRLGRFYGGAFRLAAQTGAPLVPLALTGTGKLLPPGRLSVRPTRVTLTALAPFDPADYPGELGHRELMASVRAAVAGVVDPKAKTP